MRIWMPVALTVLLSACSSLDTVQDPLSWHCQQQLDEHRNQPPPRDKDRHAPPPRVSPISSECEREMRRDDAQR